MCVAGPHFLQLTGTTEENLIQPALQAKVTNDQHFWLLDAVYSTLGRQSLGGEVRETKQMVYDTEGICGHFMSRESPAVLGIILPDFAH